MRLLSIVALLASFAVVSPALAQRQVLPPGASPVRYDLTVAPNPAAETFNGQIRIEVQVDRALPALTLNALDLTVSRAAVDGRAVTPTANAEAQTLILPGALGPGRHTVEIAYAGKINRDAYGLFGVEYDTPGGKRRMLATQFEPGDARRFAPMFDQPDLKAVWALTVDAPAGEVVIGNMPEASRAPTAGGRTRIAFQPTPKMSSYLLFLAMGDLERISARHGSVDVGVVARRGEAEKGRYALESAVRVLAYFDEYFGTPYPLPKLDMIAVPGAGGFGAMENWGAILYFDKYVLLDPALSSESDRQEVFLTVAHEIAHQWFGNLVTMRWWDDLWLNEGFASWMEFKSADALNPEWNAWLGAAAGRDAAMDLDSRRGTHPVVQTVETLDQANSAFDTITYQKGQAVIRMLEAWIGEDAFRDGVRAYMRRHAYANTETADLWRALEGASRLPVARVADSFTRQEGVPVLRVEACAGEAPLRVWQTRFVTDTVKRQAQTWLVPLQGAELHAGVRLNDLLETQGPERIEGSTCFDYGDLDLGRDGWFRILHAPEQRQALRDALITRPATEQLGVLQDYWAFGRSSAAPMADYLALVEALPDVPDPRVELQVVGAIVAIDGWQTGRPGQAAWRTYALGRLRPTFGRIGWTPQPGEAAATGPLREALILALARMGDAAVTIEAQRRASAAARDPALLPGAIRQATLRAAGAGADAVAWERLREQAAATPGFVEAQQLWTALASARDPTLAERALALALTDGVPRPQRLNLIRAVAREHPGVAWRFVIANRAALEPLLDPLQRLQFLPEIAGLSSDGKVADELDAYARTLPEGNRAEAARASAAIRDAAATRTGRAPEVDAWLAARR